MKNLTFLLKRNKQKRNKQENNQKRALINYILMLTTLILGISSCNNKTAQQQAENLIGYYEITRAKITNTDQNSQTKTETGNGILEITSFSHDNKISIYVETTIIDEWTGYNGQHHSSQKTYNYTFTGTVDKEGVIQFDPIDYSGQEFAGFKISNKRDNWHIDVTNSTLKLTNNQLSGMMLYSAYNLETGEYANGNVTLSGIKIY